MEFKGNECMCERLFVKDVYYALLLDKVNCLTISVSLSDVVKCINLF